LEKVNEQQILESVFMMKLDFRVIQPSNVLHTFKLFVAYTNENHVFIGPCWIF